MHALDVLGDAVGTPVPVRRRPPCIQLERFRRFWSRRLDALGTELARARRERHYPLAETPSADGRPGSNNEEEEDE
ncbi:hypothetical protein ABT294_29210 [Nonomuraea sp. NPDC000554]|uniref:hypothetical protein n=1 Tax=Nonomuraea sp. NPDC000554 TaxID=3154259 RepID=UPI003316E964